MCTCRHIIIRESTVPLLLHACALDRLRVKAVNSLIVETSGSRRRDSRCLSSRKVPFYRGENDRLRTVMRSCAFPARRFLRNRHITRSQLFLFLSLSLSVSLFPSFFSRITIYSRHARKLTQASAPVHSISFRPRRVARFTLR